METISDKLDSTAFRSLEFVETTAGTDALLVGTTLGIYRALDPAADDVWTEVGRNLPNLLVTDLDFVDRPGATPTCWWLVPSAAGPGPSWATPTPSWARRASSASSGPTPPPPSPSFCSVA